MNRKIIGITVGTPLNPKKIAERIPPSPGGTANGIPAGGKAGQYLCKKSDDDYDVEWTDLVIPEQYGLVTYDQDKTITIT